MSRHLGPLLVVPLSLAASCALPQLDLMPRYGQLDVEGSFGASTDGVSASADLEEAGLDDTEGIPGLRADLKFGGPHLIVQAGQGSFSGDGMLTAEIEAGGVTIPAGAAVETDLDLGLYSGTLVFDLFPTDLGELGIGFGATVIDFDASFFDPMQGESVDAAETIPVPTLSLVAGLQLGPLELQGLVNGSTLEIDDNSGTLIDADGFLRLRFFGGSDRVRASLVGGYRYVDLDFEYSDSGDDFEGDVTFQGPYVGLEFTL